jgi:hypothetical protein
VCPFKLELGLLLCTQQAMAKHLSKMHQLKILEISPLQTCGMERMVYFTDYCNTAEVVAQLPPGGVITTPPPPPSSGIVDLSNRPTVMKIHAADVRRQETDSSTPVEPHGTMSVSLWFPKINSFLPVAAFTSHSHGNEIGKPMLENTPVWIRDSNQNTIMQNFFAPADGTSPIRISTSKNIEISAELVLPQGFAPIEALFTNIPADHPSPLVKLLKSLDNVSCKIPNLRIKFKGLENSIEIEESGTSTLPSGWRQETTPDSGGKAGFAWVEFEMYIGMPKMGFSSFTLAGIMQKNIKRTFTL